MRNLKIGLSLTDMKKMWQNQNGEVGDTSLCFLHKNQQLHGYPWTKTALGKLRSPHRNLQQHSGTRYLRITTQRERKNSLTLPASSHHPGQHHSAPTGNPLARNSCYPHGNRESRASSQLPSLLVHHTRDLFQSRPAQRMTKLNIKTQLKIRKKSRGYNYQPQ